MKRDLPELYSKKHSVKCSYDSPGRWQQGTSCHSTTGASLFSDTPAPHLPMQTSASAGYCVIEHLTLPLLASLLSMQLAKVRWTCCNYRQLSSKRWTYKITTEDKTKDHSPVTAPVFSVLEQAEIAWGFLGWRILGKPSSIATCNGSASDSKLCKGAIALCTTMNWNIRRPMFASRVQAPVHCSFKGRKRETSMCSLKLQSETQMTGIMSTV